MLRRLCFLALVAVAGLGPGGCARRPGNEGPVLEPRLPVTAEEREQAKALVKAGDEQLRRGQQEQALDSYEQALTKDGDNARAYYGRGRIRLKQAVPTEKGKWLNEYLLQAAIDDLGRAIELDGNFQKAYLRRGQAHLTRALAWFRDRGRAEETVSDLEAAKRDFTTAIELNARDAQAYLGRGQVFQAYEDYEAAISDYEKTLALNSSLTEARKHWKECKEKLGEATGRMWSEPAGSPGGNVEDE